MSLITSMVKTSRCSFTCSGLILPTLFLLSINQQAVASPPDASACREKLSKKAAMIYDDVQKKRPSESNLEDVWKEVTRDLITANILGREDATAPAKDALNCLRMPE